MLKDSSHSSFCFTWNNFKNFLFFNVADLILLHLGKFSYKPNLFSDHRANSKIGQLDHPICIYHTIRHEQSSVEFDWAAVNVLETLKCDISLLDLGFFFSCPSSHQLLNNQPWQCVAETRPESCGQISVLWRKRGPPDCVWSSNSTSHTHIGLDWTICPGDGSHLGAYSDESEKNREIC